MPPPVRRLRETIAGLARPRTRETLPVRFDRRRVYILPTRFGLFFGALLATMALGALNYNNNPALLLALLLAGAALTSLLLAHLQLSGLEVVAAGGEPVPAGTPLPLRVHVRAAPGRTRRRRVSASVSWLMYDRPRCSTLPLSLSGAQ